MNTRTRAWYRCLVVLALGVGVGTAPLAGQDLAIRNVTTIDPLTGQVRAAQTVLVDDGVIQSITAGLPDDARPERIVDGTGRYLIPGLWDMHVHLDLHTETDLVMLVVNGVLNVRDMGGDPFALAELKARIGAGEILGPSIRGAGSILEDRDWLTRARQTFPSMEHRLAVDNPEEARALVAMLDSWGVDLVKIRNIRNQATLGAILDAAEQHGLTVAGHEPTVVEIDEGARLGMTTFEHLPFIGLTMPGRQADEDRLVVVSEALRNSGAYVTPTLVAGTLMDASRDERAAAIERADERYQYLSDSAKEQWLESLEGDAGPLPWTEMLESSLEIARQMDQAGVPFLTGTDMGVPLSFPGFALHDELELMADRIGLDPLTALRAATANPAGLFGVDAGAIAPGMPADLVLLARNPLTDISNTRSIEAVVLRGELIDRAKIDELLAFVRENKHLRPPNSAYQHLESECSARPSAECLERLGGYQFSLFRFSDARAAYERALAAGAGETALEGLFSSTVNLLHAGEIDCSVAAATAGTLLARHPSRPSKAVGVLDRILAPATTHCPGESEALLSRLAAIDPAALDGEMLPIYRERYASYLAHVKDDPEAAFEYRVASLPEDWRESDRHLKDVASWCLQQNVALDRARALARRAAERAPTRLGGFEMTVLEARIASAAGDHAHAVALMEKIDQAVPNNRTVTGLLETFRELAASED